MPSTEDFTFTFTAEIIQFHPFKPQQVTANAATACITWTCKMRHSRLAMVDPIYANSTKAVDAIRK
jgi:hypothetical protein